MADLEDEMKKGQESIYIEGVQVESKRFWSLEYVDDLVTLAKNKEGMKEVVKRRGI